MKLLSNIIVLFCVIATTLPARAQTAVPPPMPAYQPLGDAQLDQLLGPIALYPDPLLSQILTASTYPTEIVLADRYVSGGGDPNLLDQQPWDASVQALGRYPNVLQWLDDNLNWTTQAGQVFLNQPQDVMESIQRLRQSASNLGNLQSTPQQQVITDGGYIQIVPVDPQVIYLPVYQPAQVYYDQSVYGSPFITFGIGCAIGIWLDCDFDWGNHRVIVWNRSHPRPVNWWHEPPRQRNMAHATVWRPDNHPTAVTAYRGDRGWSAPKNQIVVATVSRSVSDSAAPHRSPPPAARPAPVYVQHAAPVSRPESNGAFIGVQSSHDTKTYSNRGQQSLQTTTHSAPISRPATSSGSGGGNGGEHSSNSQKRN